MVTPGDEYISLYDVERSIDTLKMEVDHEREERGGEDSAFQTDAEKDLRVMERLYEQIKGDWNLIHEDAYEDYCRETCYDLGMVEEDSFIENFIDWKEVAESMKMDYSYLEWEGETYYFRYT